MAVDLRLLGELEIHIGDRLVDIGPARQKCVFVALLVDANRTLSINQLIDRVWADHFPQRAREVLYSYVSRLRGSLADADDIKILRRADGYVLTVDPMAVDLYRFRRLIAQAPAGDDEAAADLLDEALALWRGEPFATLDTPWLNAIRDALNGERLAAELDRNDRALAVGRHTALLNVLWNRHAEARLDERLACQLMLALYRCGRQADALDVYQQTRMRLAEQLGADPSPPMQQLHRRILQADPALAAPTLTAADPADARSDSRPRKASRLDTAAADLAAVVRQTWQREAVERGLLSPPAIPVRVTSANPNTTAHPAQWATLDDAQTADAAEAAVAQLTGTAADIPELYDRVTSGRLVIIGEPGAGKTSVALLLLLALHDRLPPGGRIPVWLPLGSWDPSVSTVARWMADQLSGTYGTPVKVATDLVNQDRILPLLDGLDEIPERHRRDASRGLRALDASPMILTCRTAQYMDIVADRALPGAAVVDVMAVDADTAAAYLTRSSTANTARWDAVINALRSSAPNPCQQALRSPLMLSLARIVYQAPAADPTEITTYPTAAEMEDRLLGELIASVYGRDLADTAPEDAHRWLSFFAKNQYVLGPEAIAWWRLPLCVPRWQLNAVSAAIGLLVGTLAVWILTGLLGVFYQEALVFGFAVALAGSGIGASVGAPAQWRRLRRPNLRDGAKAGMLSGVVVGAAAGVVGWAAGAIYLAQDVEMAQAVRSSLLGGIGFALLAGLLAALAVGLSVSFSRRQLDTATPLSAFRSDIKATLGTGALVGLAVWLTAAVVGGLTLAMQPSLTLDLACISSDSSTIDLLLAAALFGFMLGLPAGLGTVLWFGSRKSAAWRYWIATALLRGRNDLPRRPLRFLQDAYRRGVLRQAGMVYEFRHARLGEHLRTISRRSGS